MKVAGLFSLFWVRLQSAVSWLSVCLGAMPLLSISPYLASVFSRESLAVDAIIVERIGVNFPQVISVFAASFCHDFVLGFKG